MCWHQAQGPLCSASILGLDRPALSATTNTNNPRACLGMTYLVCIVHVLRLTWRALTAFLCRCRCTAVEMTQILKPNASNRHLTLDTNGVTEHSLDLSSDNYNEG